MPECSPLRWYGSGGYPDWVRSLKKKQICNWVNSSPALAWRSEGHWDMPTAVFKLMAVVEVEAGRRATGCVSLRPQATIAESAEQVCSDWSVRLSETALGLSIRGP